MDYVIVMNDGRITDIGPLNELNYTSGPLADAIRSYDEDNFDSFPAGKVNSLFPINIFADPLTTVSLTELVNNGTQSKLMIQNWMCQCLKARQST